MGVSKNRVFPQNGWFIMENHIEMDDVGGKPTIFGNIHKIQPFYRPVAVQANRRERKGVLRVAADLSVETTAPVLGRS